MRSTGCNLQVAHERHFEQDMQHGHRGLLCDTKRRSDGNSNHIAKATEKEVTSSEPRMGVGLVGAMTDLLYSSGNS